jgi:hypothetical protein
MILVPSWVTKGTYVTNHWAGRGWGPFVDLVNGVQDTWDAFPIIGASALRRTQAACTVRYSSQTIPPETGSVGGKALFLRVLMVPESGDPPDGWPTDPDVGDDVLFEPIIWQTAVYMPANVDFGRPESLHYTGSLIDGLAISKSQRVFGFGEHGIVNWWVGPLQNLDTGTGFDDFSFSLTLRQLWDDSPSS